MMPPARWPSFSFASNAQKHFLLARTSNCSEHREQTLQESFLMLKKTLLVLAQLILFYLVFLAGSLLDPFKMKWFLTHPTPLSTRFYVPDGLLLMIGLYLLILIAEALAKRIRTAGTLTSIAFVLVLALGVFSKFGWVTRELF
jgi:hypothetical protein